MQIQNIRKGLEGFEYKFKPFEWDSKHSKVIASIRMQIREFERDSKHSNANSNHSKGIRSIQMEMITTWKVFEAF